MKQLTEPQKELLRNVLLNELMSCAKVLEFVVAYEVSKELTDRIKAIEELRNWLKDD